MKRFGRWTGGLLLVVMSLLLAEVTLQVASRHLRPVHWLLTPTYSNPQYVADSVLGRKGNPRWFDHDALGFRNAAVVNQADVVTMGDSHTYGAGVDRSQSWPFLLSANSGQTVYNMAFGGWSPVQGYLLLSEALQLRPATVVYGLYFGNDSFDVFYYASLRPELRQFLPQTLLDTIAVLEATDPIPSRVGFLFSLGDTAAHGSQGAPSALRRLLSQHSKLYGLARALRGVVAGELNEPPAILSPDIDRAMERLTNQQRSFVSVYRDPEWTTLLTPRYRQLLIDDRDPRIRAGIEGTKALLAAMDSLCRRTAVRFVVVLLPTKETVFASRIRELGKYESLDSLVWNEKRVHDEVVTWLMSRNIEYLDVLPALRMSTAQPYFVHADGHPNEVGHQVIAGAIVDRLRLGQ